MKEKILQLVDAYWKFDNEQQPISSWHDKQDLLKALEELFEPAAKPIVDKKLIISNYNEEKAKQITEEGRKNMKKIQNIMFGIVTKNY